VTSLSQNHDKRSSEKPTGNNNLIYKAPEALASEALAAGQ